jgi:uracil-DNA glycosylase
MSDLQRDIVTVEIMGTREGGRGRHCAQHFCCGIELLEVGSFVVFCRVTVPQTPGGEEEPAIAAYWISNGYPSCRVGFLPKELIPRSGMFHNRIGCLLENFHTSENGDIKSISRRNLGVWKAEVYLKWEASDPSSTIVKVTPFHARTSQAGTAIEPTVLQTSQTRNKHNKYEQSPNSLAKCQECNELIRQGTFRWGIVCVYKGEERWKYYHNGCLDRCYPSSDAQPQMSSDVQSLVCKKLDKYERSPNSLAKCQECNQLILQGTFRCGRVYVYKGEERWKYYHNECLDRSDPSSKGQLVEAVYSSRSPVLGVDTKSRRMPSDGLTNAKIPTTIAHADSTGDGTGVIVSAISKFEPGQGGGLTIASPAVTESSVARNLFPPVKPRSFHQNQTSNFASQDSANAETASRAQAVITNHEPDSNRNPITPSADANAGSELLATFCNYTSDPRCPLLGRASTESNTQGGRYMAIAYKSQCATSLDCCVFSLHVAPFLAEILAMVRQDWRGTVSRTTQSSIEGIPCVTTTAALSFPKERAPNSVVNLFRHLCDSWKHVLSKEMTEEEKAILIKLIAKLKVETTSYTVYPPPHQIFAALNMCPLEHICVVIVAQDPYHGPGQADGLVFSIPRGRKPFPPSLLNIIVEAALDVGIPEPKHGNLDYWASQGVLLLDSILTVRHGEAKSHFGWGWEAFTSAVVRCVSEQRSGVVFMLWGSMAHQKQKWIDKDKHHIIKTSHPSPRGAEKTDTPFKTSGCFGKCNEALRLYGKDVIDWTIQ